MTRKQIVTVAKDIVLFHGAYTVEEFGEELVDRFAEEDWTNGDREAVLRETRKQADRAVRFFLGGA